MSGNKGGQDRAERRAARAESALAAIPSSIASEEWLKISAAYMAAGGTYEGWHDWCECSREAWAQLPNYRGRAEDLFRAARKAGWLEEDIALAAESAETPRRATNGAGVGQLPGGGK